MSISVVYWSGTGNTQAMAEAIGEGIEENGAQAKVMSVDQASVDALAGEDVFALGCSAMGAEELEESEMEPFVAELEGKVSGKKILLFGSYGWGDGEWMRNWVDQMKNAGADVIGGEDAICADAPDDETEAKLVELGKQLAAC